LAAPSSRQPSLRQRSQPRARASWQAQQGGGKNFDQGHDQLRPQHTAGYGRRRSDLRLYFRPAAGTGSPSSEPPSGRTIRHRHQPPAPRPLLWISRPRSPRNKMMETEISSHRAMTMIPAGSRRFPVSARRPDVVREAVSWQLPENGGQRGARAALVLLVTRRGTNRKTRKRR